MEYKEYLLEKLRIKDSINTLNRKLSELDTKFDSDLQNLKGKYFNSTSSTNEWAYIGNSDRYKPINQLYDICQVLKINTNSVLIQKFQEKIAIPCTGKRLTYDCTFEEIPFVEFLNTYKKEISLEVFMNTIKAMQDRDNYTYGPDRVKII
jgi:hypothetical protein